MTDKDDKDIQEKINDLFQNYSLGIVKVVFTILDTLLSLCNSFEDLKSGVKQTVVNLTEEEEKK